MTVRNSIKRKLVTVIMLTSLIVLILTVVAFMVYDLATFRRTMVQNLVTMAKMTADYSNVAMEFEDKQVGDEALNALHTDPHIVAAALYDKDGNVFTKYPTNLEDLPAAPTNFAPQFSQSHLIVAQPVYLYGKRLGTLYLSSDTREMTDRLKLYATISLTIMAASLLVAFGLSSRMQKQISLPIIALADVARKISTQADYSVRAVKMDDDELGVLTDAFNKMLTRIEENSKNSALLVAIIESSDDAIVSKNLNGIITSWNKGAERLFGYLAAEVIGRSITILIPPALISEESDILKKIQSGTAIEHFETVRLRKNGEAVDVSLTISPIYNELGKVTGASKTARNITEKKRAERDLKRARDEAVAASRAKDEFLAALSHELRTPLNPVLLLASEAAENKTLPPDVRQIFDVIAKNAELEARLIDDLLDLTRVTRGKLSLAMQSTDVHAVLQDALNTVRADVEEKSIQITKSFQAEKTIIWGDAVRLQQIFWNILKNAVKFTPPQGRISILTRTENDRVSVRVEDSGMGMTAEELSRIFTAFAQGDHAATGGSHRFGGLGLGLAISQKLAELHSGKIHGTSNGRNFGSTFVIDLPVHADAKEAEVFSPPDNPNAIPSRIARMGSRILLVEDHEATRVALIQLLQRRDYQVIAAASVSEALRLAANEKFDFAISDIGLPDGDGYSLMKQLQNLYKIKGIALSGYGMDTDILRSQEAGFVAHLTKPVRVQSLVSALENIQALLHQPT